METKRLFMNHSFTISVESFDFGWNMPRPHCHDCYEIYILSNGNRTVFADAIEYQTEQYDVVLFNRNVPHKSCGNSPFAGICIHFLDSYLNLYFTKKAKAELLRCFQSKIIRLSETQFNKIKYYADNFIENDSGNFIILADILNLLCPVIDSEEFTSVKNHSAYAANQCRILNYVEENYTEINRIDELAKKFSVSERYIYKIFHEAYGTSPKERINTLKLNNVCKRLKYTDLTVKELAADSGFECYEYFLRLFRKKIGCTPAEYRRVLR